MKILIPGSFDPPTNGHIDVINRCSKIFTEIIVGVVVNPSKDSLFTRSERSEMLEKIFQDKQNIKIDSFEGLLVDFASKNNVDAIVKGLRAMTDFDYEFQMSLTNRRLANNIDTIFFMTDEKYSYLSSSIVKQVCRYGGDIASFVPMEVAMALKEKLK